MNADYVILGGGIAGLCAARRLVELGVTPLVVEAGDYPCHKVCGEFISPGGLAILNNWGIHPKPIYQAYLHTFSKSLKFPFPTAAGSLSHWTLDSQLAQEITEKGAILLTRTKVEVLSPATNCKKPHLLQLSSGEKVFAKHLLIATGRVPGLQSRPLNPRYMGFKAHFSKIDLNSTLEMFSFPGAYLGLAPVENGWTNLACLATLKRVQKDHSPQSFMQDLIQSHPRLRDLLISGHNLFDGWMEVSIPEFGLRSPPPWPRTYWIGDAAATIPPACGNGLTLALLSGYLAAEFAVRDQAPGFKHEWKKRCASQILFGKGLHSLFLHPLLGNGMMHIVQRVPRLGQTLFSLTRN